MHVGMRIPGHIGKLSIEEQIAFAKEIGLDAIDLPGPDPVYKKALDEAGLKAGSFDVGESARASTRTRACAPEVSSGSSRISPRGRSWD